MQRYVFNRHFDQQINSTREEVRKAIEQREPEIEAGAERKCFPAGIPLPLLQFIEKLPLHKGILMCVTKLKLFEGFVICNVTS